MCDLVVHCFWCMRTLDGIFSMFHHELRHDRMTPIVGTSNFTNIICDNWIRFEKFHPVSNCKSHPGGHSKFEIWSRDAKVIRVYSEYFLPL